MNERASGVALIGGSIGGLIVMALHPTSGSVEGLVREQRILMGTHSLGIAMMPVLFFGFAGVTKRTWRSDVLAPAALITFGLATIAAVFAAALNGLAAPAFATRVVGEAAVRDAARVVLGFNYQLNAALGRIFMASASAALMFWAGAAFRTHTFPPWTTWLAGGLGLTGFVAVSTGVLGTSVLAVGVFVLGFSAWAISVGLLLIGPHPSRAPSPGRRV